MTLPPLLQDFADRDFPSGPPPPPTQFTLTTAAAGAGSGAVTGAGSYISGAVATPTATPAVGSAFTGWSGACSGTGVCQVTMDADKSVTATFAVQQFTLTTGTSGTGSGSVGGAGTYDYGTVVNVTETPAAGSTFTGWSGNCSGTGACSVTMTGNRSVTAAFSANTFVLTTGTTGSGTATGAGTYAQGAVVTPVATPASGQTFLGWGGACSGTGACSVTMNSNQTVTASFSQAPAVTGPLFLRSEYHDLMGNPAFAIGAFGAISGSSKHLAAGKVDGRWYRLGGDMAVMDPLSAVDGPTNSEATSQAGRNEVLSWTCDSDYSWRIETHEYMRASESALQGWNYDDPFGAARAGHGEVYAWRAAGVASVVTQPTGPNGPYATLLNKPMAFVRGGSPGTGSWRDPGTFAANGQWNNSWRAFYDQTTDRFLVPTATGGIIIQQAADSPTAWTDMSVRSVGGVLIGIQFPGDTNFTYAMAMTPGFIRANKLYLLMQRSQDTVNTIVEIDLATLYTWAAATPPAAQPAGLVTVIGPTPEKIGGQGQMDLDTVNDVIFFQGNVSEWIRGFTDDPTTGWQSFPRTVDGHVSYDASGTITVSANPGTNGSWSTQNVTGGSDKPGPFDFQVTISGAFVGTATLQHDTGNNGVFIDVATWTAPAANIQFNGGSYLDVWRVGVKHNEWTSGSIKCTMAWERVLANTRRLWDVDYGGMISICNIDNGTLTPGLERRDEKGYYVLKTGALPAWIPQPGQLKLITPPSGVGSSISTVNVCPQTGCANQGSQGGIGSFSGGIYNPYYGTYGMIIAHGGGDADYYGNPIVGCDLNDLVPTWKLVKATTSAQMLIPALGGSYAAEVAAGRFNDDWGDWNEPGGGGVISPQSIHSYDQMDIKPPYAGGGPKGSLVRANTVGFQARGWLNAHQCDLDTGVWTRASTTTAKNGSSPAWHYPGNITGASMVWIPTLSAFVEIANVNSSFGFIVLLDFRYPTTSDGTGPGVFRRQTIGAAYQDSFLGTSLFWPENNMLVNFNGLNILCFDMLYFGVNNSVSDHNYSKPFRAVMAGDSFPQGFPNWGFALDTKRRCFWAYIGAVGQKQFIYKITPPTFAIKTNPWVVQRITMPSTPPNGVNLAVGDTGISAFSRRLAYSESTDCLLFWLYTNGGAYAFRPL